MTIASRDGAAALANTRLIAVTVQDLLDIQNRPTSADQDCGDVIARFARSLRGDRRDTYSAWVSLNLAVGRRLKSGPIKQAVMRLGDIALKEMTSEGRFV